MKFSAKRARKEATWATFCLVALSTVYVGATQDTLSSTGLSSSTTLEASSLSTATPSTVPVLSSTDNEVDQKTSVETNTLVEKEDHTNPPNRSPENDKAAEAENAYLQALQVLAPLEHASSAQSHSSESNMPSSFLASFFPNHRGPIATAIRIAARLRQQSWLPNFLSVDSWLSGKRKEEMSSRAVKIIDLLGYAIELGHTEALYTLARISLFPPPALPLNLTRAFEYYEKHAQATGNATSQSMLGYFYSTGYGGVVPVDQAKALLYYSFAGIGGDHGAELALGYRYWSGISVKEDCMSALDWYEAAAQQAIAKFQDGPPGGRTLSPTWTRLSDLVGGVYGPGASVASTGRNAQRPVIRAANAQAAGETWSDVLEYYEFHAERGEIEFAYRLGKIYYQGSIYPSPGGIASGSEGVGAVPQDFNRARNYFLRIARLVWPRDLPASPHSRKDADEITYATAGLAATYLGRMFLRGEGVSVDYKIAKMWFERGANFGDKEAHNALGIIWRDGLLGKKDDKVAYEYFRVAAGQDLAEAQVNLGKYHYYRGEIQTATTLFENAIRNNSPFEAYYYIALIYSQQARLPTTPTSSNAGSCAIATSFFKLVAERGSCWDDDLVTSGEKLWRSGDEKQKEAAMVRWSIAAERGFETAQNNLAFVLDQDKSSLRHPRYAPTPSNETARLALTQWTRSAAQRNVDALVKVGDYYFHGLGVTDEPEQVRWERAAGFYHSAVETQMSAVAMWNLGWMYENGYGVVQDFHLAKRYYDMALETNHEAYLPVVLSLIKLHLRSLWHTMSGGKQKGLTLWGVEGDDDHWYLGKAKEEFKRRWAGDKKNADKAAGDAGRGQLDGGQGSQDTAAERRSAEEDPIQWARDHRAALERAQREEDGEDDDFGPEDYFDGMTRRRRHATDDEEEEDEFWETMILVGLCLALSGLVWLRGRWVARRQEEERQARQAAGLPVNDPPPPAGEWDLDILR